MNLLYSDARDLCPRLVCVRVIVQELISQHEGNSQKSIFATWSASNGWIRHLQSIDKHQGQQDHVLGDLRRGQDRVDPFPEGLCGNGVRTEGGHFLICWCKAYVLRSLEYCGSLEPEETCELQVTS